MAWRAAGNVVERIAETVVLAEDLRQGNFLRHYLIRCGQHSRRIVLRLSQRGRGSGEQYVRERYPIEVAYYRQRSHARSAALAVVLDADSGTVEQHERELADSLQASNQRQREDGEAIALIIPKRNIETWLLCLSGEPVTEAENHKGQPRIDSLIKSAAGTFYEWNRDRANVPAPCVPSLRRGLDEARRIC
jgi:hypothetical protein